MTQGIEEQIEDNLAHTNNVNNHGGVFATKFNFREIVNCKCKQNTTQNVAPS